LGRAPKPDLPLVALPRRKQLVRLIPHAGERAFAPSCSRRCRRRQQTIRYGELRRATRIRLGGGEDELQGMGSRCRRESDVGALSLVQARPSQGEGVDRSLRPLLHKTRKKPHLPAADTPASPKIPQAHVGNTHLSLSVLLRILTLQIKLRPNTRPDDGRKRSAIQRGYYES